MIFFVSIFLNSIFFSCGQSTEQSTPSATIDIDSNTIEELASHSADIHEDILLKDKQEVVQASKIESKETQEEESITASKPESDIDVEIIDVNEEENKKETVHVENEEVVVKEGMDLKENEADDVMNTTTDVVDVIALDHSAFDALVNKHISTQGLVNYTAFKKDESALDAYLNQLSSKETSSSWSDDEQLAYWINAYNAFTIKLILKNHPVSKIIDLDGGDPWKVKWIEIGGKSYSLNNIEHDIIRPQFNEPRIHFAVNCAAQSCPPIQNRAYTAENLEDLLEKSTRTFINNSKFNKIKSSKAQLSKIFEWYGEDFGDLKSFINKYSSTKLDASTSIEYLEYDWSLNGE